MGPSKDGKAIGRDQLVVYDNLIKQYINMGRDFVTPEQIEELFPNNNDPNEENNNNNNNENNNGEENGGGRE